MYFLLFELPSHTGYHSALREVPCVIQLVLIIYFMGGGSESEICSVLPNSLWPHGLYSPWNSPGQNTGVGSLSLLQGIFPTPGSNPGLPHCRWILYQLNHKGSPRILEWVAYPFSRGSSQPRNQTGVSCIAGRFFTNWAIREVSYIVSKLCGCQSQSLKSTHPLFTPWYPYICSLCVCLYFWFADNIICTICSVHVCINIQYSFFSFWLTSLRMTLFRSTHISANNPSR